MLYPQSREPLTPERFRTPGREYRATPFWAWNNRLDRQELLWQIEQLKQMGFGGFHIHVRTGMATEYLGEAYLEDVRACVRKAGEEDMLAWLYDEDRWPSGAAGGLVTRDPGKRQRFLIFSREAADEGETLAAFDVELNPDGTLRAYHTLVQGDAPRGFALYARVQIAGDNPWFNNQAYLNTLDPKSVRAFIRTTHERFYEAVGDAFGKDVPAIFTDEPQFSRKQALSYAQDERPVTLPWTDDLPQTFHTAYGEDLVAGLPELLWDFPGGRVSTLRYHYHDHIAERFTQAFADQLGEWCAGHGLMLTGHMMEEPTLESQTCALGEAMRSYRAFQLPGIDMLCDRREYTTAKQAQSASRQYAREGVLSELYGVTNWDFDLRGHKLQGDWQAALGVTVRVPHLSWVSMNGEAKRDYPGTFNYQAPWYREYPYVEDHFARVNTALTRGRARCRVGVVHPVESYWLHWGAQENTQAIREQMDEQFEALTQWLLRGMIDFDFICESLLPDQCDLQAITGEALRVGAMRYEAVLVPPVETLRRTTVERLARFRAAGGRVIFLGGAPGLMDAVPSGEPEALHARCEHCAFARVAVLQALEDLRDVEIRDAHGARTSGLLYQMREEESGERWLFVCHADNPQNKDLPIKQALRIRLRGEWALNRYDTLTGDIKVVHARAQHGWTIYETDFYDHDSLLMRMTPGALACAAPESQSVQTQQTVPLRFLQAAPFTLDEPNVLLLDMPEYALDDGPFRPREEVLRLDDALRTELGWPLRGEAWAQPWVEQDKSMPHMLTLRFTFGSEAAVQGARLALEDAGDALVTLNGEPAADAEGFYVDKCIGCLRLPQIAPGRNTLTIRMPYGKTRNVEACYLLGAFGVNVQGSRASLYPAPHRISFGDVTRQGYPFYGGNLTYHLEADLAPGRYELAASLYRGHLLRVAVDGKDAGIIAFSPYALAFDVPQGGKHRIDLTVYGCRINTFGQLHQTDKTHEWWGPGSWRSTGAEWAYEYCLYPQGVLKSPELRRL